VAVLAGAPVKGPPLGELVCALGADFLILTTWAAFGALLATLLRSTALSIGIGLVYSLVLETVIFNLPIRNESFTNARDFFPGQNSSSLADSFSEQAPTGFSHPRRHPSTPHRLRSYSSPIPATFIVLAALVFRRRDVE